MKIGILHPYPVYSAAVGGTTRVFALVCHLAPRHEVTVFSHSSGSAEADARAIRELRALGVESSIEPLPLVGRMQKLHSALDATPYFVHRNRNPRLEAALGECVRSRGLDLIHVEFAYLAPLLRHSAGMVPWVLAEQETMSLACERLGKLRWREKTFYEHLLQREQARVRRFEASVLPGFSRIYGITPAEAERMRAQGGNVVGVLPHVVRTDVFTPDRAATEQGRLLFVGNYGHAPNVHGLRWFLERVWGALRAQRPSLEFCVVGPGLAQPELRLLESGGGRWLGHVEDLVAEYRRATVFVNPLHVGGGMRGKVLEALACGCPLVSTALGMEGVEEAREDVHFLRADGSDEFIERLLFLLAHPDRRLDLAVAGRKLAVEHYNAAQTFDRLESGFLETLEARRPRPRCQVGLAPSEPTRRTASRVTPGISVQIVTWNHVATLDACLASVWKQAPGLLETIVVDNASTDDSAARAHAWSEKGLRLRLLRESENTGFCAGQNRALAESRGEWVLLLNPDACLSLDFASRAEALLARVPADVGTLAPLLLLPDGNVDSTGLTIDGLRRAYDRDHGRTRSAACGVEGEVFGATGAVVLHRRAMLEDIAVHGAAFDERLFAYYDDIDVAWRARLRGWRCLYVPDLLALHERGARNSLRGISGRSTDARAQALTVRNRLLVMLKCEEARALFLAAPKLIAFELARILYLGIRSPGALRGYPSAAREIAATLRARRIVRARGKDPKIRALSRKG
ncbi:MAG: glycosyltransferase [Betaproteobacteria bacterium]|nr:glycosyltransferase [Betaproteobacteria bacterium]